MGSEVIALTIRSVHTSQLVVLIDMDRRHGKW